MSKEKQVDDLGPPEEEQALIREQMEEALREKEQFRAMAQRAQADLINYKRRIDEERREFRRNANSQLLLKVLSIADDLDRAVALVPDDAAAPGWFEGLRLVRRKIDNILTSEGITKIEADGRAFEPREHEAAFYEETPDGEEGMVVSVIRDGYKLHDKVLRPAQVAVSKAPEPSDPRETTEQET